MKLSQNPVAVCQITPDIFIINPAIQYGLLNYSLLAIL